MKTFATVVAAAVLGTGLLAPFAPPANAGFFASAEEKRQRIDLNARHALEKLLASDAKAQRLYDRAFGYAVFGVTKGALIITGGGGAGVAVHKLTDKRTYMHVGMGGIGLGIGGQAFQLIVLFEDEKTFQEFTASSWGASSSANAVAGRSGANAEASFTNGAAFYQLTEAGLLLQADIAGTRYWRSNRLNASLDDSVRTASVETVESVPMDYVTEVPTSSTSAYDYGTQTTVYPLETNYNSPNESLYD